MPILKKTNKPERSPLMVLFLGVPSSGKTTTAMTFPDPLILDIESGTRQYRNMIDGAVIHTKQFGEALRVVREFKTKGKVTWKEGNETLEYVPKTFVIDPLTGLWDSIQAAKFQDSMDAQGLSTVKGTEKPKNDSDTFSAWNAIKTHWKTLHSEFQNCGLHFVATAHQKDESKFTKNSFGKMEIVKTGKIVADTEKSYEYVFDLVLRLCIEDNKRFAIVEKSRLKNADGTDRFKIGQKLMQWDYSFLINGMTENVKSEDSETESEAIEKDKALIEKDPEVLRISHEIRSVLLPKRGISNEQLETYLKSKLDNSGERIALEGADGKVHLSAMSLKSILWLKGILEDDAKSMLLIGKLKEVK